MTIQRLVITKIDDILELMKDYAVDIGSHSKAVTMEFNPQLGLAALVFDDWDAKPTDREVLLAKFETKRVFSVGGNT